jgi:hypothetical protein
MTSADASNLFHDVSRLEIDTPDTEAETLYDEKLIPGENVLPCF